MLHVNRMTWRTRATLLFNALLAALAVFLTYVMYYIAVQIYYEKMA